MTAPASRSSRPAAAIAVLAILQLPALGADLPPSSDPAAELRLDRAPLLQSAGRPPAPASPQAGEDLAVLLWLQQARTPEMEANTWALLERNLVRFSRALGLDMTKSTPRIDAGIKAFLRPVDGVVGELKDRHRRLRPFLSHPQIHPCLPREQGFSFPSGHSTWYRAASELLADLVPERRVRLVSVGSHGGNSRVICGVHYPSDVEAGQRLGVAAAAQLIASPQWQAFRRDPKVLAEIREILNVPAAAMPELVR